MSAASSALPRASHSGRAKLGSADVFVHVLPGGAPVIEVTSIEPLLGLPDSGLGAFLSPLPGNGGRVEFLRAEGVCSMCEAPASHRLTSGKKSRDPDHALRCGGCANKARGMGYRIAENRGPSRVALGLPADDVPGILSAFLVANRGTAAAQKAHEILRSLVQRGMREMGQNPEAADFLMAAAMPPRSAS